jgi:hypothetical protein
MGIGTRRMTEQAWDAALGAPGAALTLDEYRAAKLSHVHWWLERVAVALGCHPTEKGSATSSRSSTCSKPRPASTARSGGG